MSPRIYSADEALALLESAPDGPYDAGEDWDCGTPADDNRFTDGWLITADDEEIAAITPCNSPNGDVDEAMVRLFAAAFDLAVSVEHHAARADAAHRECVDMSHALAAAQAVWADAHRECERLRAQVAELERLASGPRMSVDEVRASVAAEIDARRQEPPAVSGDPVEPLRRYVVSTLALAEVHLTVEAPSHEAALAVARRRDEGDWRIGDLFARPIFDGAEDVEELPSDEVDGNASIGPRGVDADGREVT